MPKTIHPLIWIRSLGREEFEDAHTCPWCGETFPWACCQEGPLFQGSTPRLKDEPEEDL
jgi:hypothetical protein